MSMRIIWKEGAGEERRREEEGGYNHGNYRLGPKKIFKKLRKIMFYCNIIARHASI
jgi:hypothetical protein